MTPRSLRANVAWAATGNAVYLACQYGILIALAKLGTTADVGRFALAQAIAAPIIVLSQMQLRQLQATDVQGKVAFGSYLSTRLSGTLIAVITVMVIGFTVDRGAGGWLIIAVIGLAKGIESLSDTAHGRLQQCERWDVIAGSLALKGIGSLALLALGLWLTGDLLIAACALAVSWLVVFCAYDLVAVRRAQPAGEPLFVWRPEVTLSLARTALPLAVAAGVASLSTNLPRYFLQSYQGAEVLALLTVAAAPLTLLGLGNAAVSQATLVRAANHFQTGELARFNRLSQGVVGLQIGLSLAVALLFALFGKPLMRLLFSEAFEPAGPLAAIMAGGVALSAVGAWGGTVISAARQFNLQLWNVLIVLAAQLPLCWLLIGRFGVVGAAWSEFARFGISAAFLIAVGLASFREKARQTMTATSGEGVAVASPL